MSTPHNRAENGDFAKTVLMPGDPLRAKFIAETFLEDPRLVTDVRGHQKAKPGLAELLERGNILPRRQTEHCHAIACLLQNAADNCQPERRVIYIRVAADIHKVGRIPAARVAFVQRHGQKSLVESIHGSLASLYHTLLLYCIGSRRNCQARFCFAKIRGIGRAISSIASATLTQPKPCSYSGSA